MAVRATVEACEFGCCGADVCVDCGVAVDPVTGWAVSDLLVWDCEGHPSSGSLVDYARAREMAGYSGFDIARDVWVWRDGGMVSREVTVVGSSFDWDDWATVVVRLDGREATYRVDGRA